ncbi:hypothetical protein PROFUN_08030 [Planoprotostelium fungivorum]|uniref:Uncharacterized protein n=1 Tax=Planoprotostelium fungivorum TaxID=1890364 RepID=A0A2P6NKF0_9EUKA|nr:hypothetical protein PROFUN_08030 [Planoprotostelium fungivorum]
MTRIESNFQQYELPGLALLADGSRRPQTFNEIWQQYSRLYVHYVRIFRDLEDSYDQMAHPQKRTEIRTMLEAIAGRILEIKDVLVRIDQQEYLNFDHILLEYKLTPDLISIPIPRYYIEERQVELQEREKLLVALISRTIKVPAEGEVAVVAPMTLEEAIKIIQMNERGRQGRQRHKEAKEIRRHEKEPVKKKTSKYNFDPAEAAVRIQKCFRGHLARKGTKEMRNEELIFVKMQAKEARKESSPMTKLQQTHALRKLIQSHNQQEYVEALVTIKQKLHEVEGPELRDKMQQEIRGWIVSHKELHGKFPQFPTEEEGGSLKIGDLLEQQKIEQGNKLLPPLKNARSLSSNTLGRATTAGSTNGRMTATNSRPATTATTSGSRPGTTKTSHSSYKRKGKKDNEESFPVLTPESNFLPIIQSSLEKFKGVWLNRDESGNFTQKYDPDLMKEGLRPEVEKEIRASVDVLLRQELENLRKTVEGKKKKKGKIAKKKRGRKKSGDLTADRSIESLHGELVIKEIIIKCPEVHLREFIGGERYHGNQAVVFNPNKPPNKAVRAIHGNENRDVPSLSEVRRAITEYCILPLGSEAIHRNAPFVKTILLYGHCGKSMITHAAVTETGSVLFDISPARFHKVIPSAEIRVTLHMVFKVAKTIAPSVLKRDRKILPGEPSQAAKNLYRKFLMQQLRSLRPTDRVVVIANTKYPQLGGKKLLSFAQKSIFLPLPDYASRILLWTQLIRSGGGKITPELDISTLSHISEGYTAAAIQTCVSETLMANRIQMIDKKPLTCTEFSNALSKLESQKCDDEVYQKFMNKVSIKPLIPENEGNPTRKEKGKGKEEKGKR